MKVNEVQDKRDIITANTVGNIDSFLAKAQNSYLVAKLLEQKNKSSKVTIHDFFSICGKIFHIILKDSLRELHSKPDSYSILTGTDGKKYAIWEIDVNHCTEDEIFDLLNESFAFKEGNDKFDYYRFKEKKIKKIELDTKLKHISSDDKFKSLTVKQLTLRARACSEAVLLAKSYGINRIIPIKTFYCSSNGKACHIIPLTSLDAKSSIKKYTIVKNKYGIKFASWMVNAL